MTIRRVVLGGSGNVWRWVRQYHRVVPVKETLTIRVPKGTRRRLEKLARAEALTLSQYVRRAIDTERLLSALEDARASLMPAARARGISTDEDVFRRIS